VKVRRGVRKLILRRALSRFHFGKSTSRALQREAEPPPVRFTSMVMLQWWSVPHAEFILESCWPGIKLIFIPKLLY
jgi:hypothetical protein